MNRARMAILGLNGTTWDVYKTRLTLRGQDPVSPIAFLDVVLKVEDLLGQ